MHQIIQDQDNHVAVQFQQPHPRDPDLVRVLAVEVSLLDQEAQD